MMFSRLFVFSFLYIQEFLWMRRDIFGNVGEGMRVGVRVRVED